MKRCLYALTIAFYLIVQGENVLSQGFLRVEGKQIVNEKGENVLLRGIGLGGWMLQKVGI